MLAALSKIIDQFLLSAVDSVTVIFANSFSVSRQSAQPPQTMAPHPRKKIKTMAGISIPLKTSLTPPNKVTRHVAKLPWMEANQVGTLNSQRVQNTQWMLTNKQEGNPNSHWFRKHLDSIPEEILSSILVGMTLSQLVRLFSSLDRPARTSLLRSFSLDSPMRIALELKLEDLRSELPEAMPQVLPAVVTEFLEKISEFQSFSNLNLTSNQGNMSSF